MKLGFSKTDITPDHPVFMSGYIERDHEMEGINDPIESIAFCFEIDGHKVLFSTTDISGFGPEQIQEIKKQVSKDTGIPQSHVNISVTHTHSGPVIRKAIYDKNADDAYIAESLKKIADNMIASASSLTEATVKYSRFLIDGVYSNRNDKNEISDKNAYLLEFYDSADKLLACMYNFSCHSTVLGSHNYILSGDLHGALRRKLEGAFGVPCLVTNGSAGDMGNRQYRQGNGFEELDRVAQDILEQTLNKMMPSVIKMDTFGLTELMHVVDSPMDHTGLSEKIADYEKKLETETHVDKVKLMKSGLASYKRKLAIDHIHIDMNCEIFNLGDLQIVTVPGELNSKLGLRIKEASHAKHCIVIGYANGSVGYIVDEKGFERDSQEANATNIPKGEPEKYIELICQHV